MPHRQPHAGYAGDIRTGKISRRAISAPLPPILLPESRVTSSPAAEPSRLRRALSTLLSASRPFTDVTEGLYLWFLVRFHCLSRLRAVLADHWAEVAGVQPGQAHDGGSRESMCSLPCRPEQPFSGFMKVRTCFDIFREGTLTTSPRAASDDHSKFFPDFCGCFLLHSSANTPKIRKRDFSLPCNHGVSKSLV